MTLFLKRCCSKVQEPDTYLKALQIICRAFKFYWTFITLHQFFYHTGN